MTDSIDSTLPARPFDAGPGPIKDPSLFLSASRQWTECRQQLLDLVGAAPGARASLRQLLHAQLALDGDQVGLTYPAGPLDVEDQTPSEQFVSLLELCALVIQQPDLSALNLDAAVSGVADQHPLHGKTALELAQRLKALAPQAFVTSQWDAYWNARAPGTPHARRDLAARHFKTHLHCAYQLSYAQGALTAAELKPLLAVLEAGDSEPLLDNEHVYIETITLLPWGAGSQRLPGALVITHDGHEPTQQLLFLPGQAPALSLFADRNALEAWLLENKHRLWPDASQVFSAVDSIGYGQQEHGIAPLFKELVNCLRNNLINSLYRHNDLPLPQSAREALAAADSFDASRSSQSLLAPAPQLPDAEDRQGAASPFGQLYADLDFAARQASIIQQRDAFEALLGTDYQGDADDPNLLTLKRAIDALSTQQLAALTAARTLVQAQTPQDLYSLRQLPNAAYDELYAARLAGLRAEAEIQQALKQLDSAEAAMIISVLDAPVALHRLDNSVVAATVSVSMTETGGARRSRELDGVLVITRQDVLDDTTANGSLLLYWPGVDGGLQRFASYAALEQMLLKPSLDDDDRHTLTLTPLSGDALAYGLQNQLHRCELRAARLLKQYPSATRAAEQAQALHGLVEKTVHALRVPHHQARETAYAQLLELNRSSALHAQLPGWLATLPQAYRHRLKTLIQHYVPAVQRAQSLLEGDIPLREDFTRARIQQRLRADFGVTGDYTLSLDLPDSVHRVRDPIQGSGAPGVPSKTVLRPSDKRTTFTLEQLALANIDDDLRDRYTFVELHVSGGNEGGRGLLLAGFTYHYLQTLVTALDLSAAYTALIRATFMGTAGEPEFKHQYRRECLRKPIQLALQMQSVYASQRGLLDTRAKAILDIAIDADSPRAWQVDGKRIVLRAALFSAGGVDTGELTATLSGVTFIEEQNSGQTLIYLPDDPTGVYLRHYASLDEAREGLFQLTLDAQIAEYLADRALRGDRAAHLSRLRQAHERNYWQMIDAGLPWPHTTSLANHLLDAHMGQMIETHRRTSRSNDALYLQQFALASENVFHYIKMALGMVPFVGTAVGLYDGFKALDQSIKALLRKDLYEGLEQFESVMLSLIDAAMDLLPGAGIANVRGATRQRQLQGLARQPSLLHRRYLSSSAAQPARRFEGYEYNGSINLSGLEPANSGIYRAVYRHPQGDFVISQGHVYAVTLHDSPRTWRLKGSSSKTYQQPITLDESGQWNTHGAVYGKLVNGGLAGGGGVLGHLADGLEPLWPAPIRGYLPDWLTNRLEHRRRVLLDAVESSKDQVQSQTRALIALRERMERASPADRGAMRAQFNAQSLKLLDTAKQTHGKLLEVEPTLTGTNARKAREDLSSLAATIVQRTEQDVYALKHSINRRYDQLDEIRAESATLPFGVAHVRAHMALWARRKQVRIGLAQDAVAMEARMAQMNEWEARVTVARHRSGVINDATAVRVKHNPCIMNVHKAQQYLEAINRYDMPASADWFALINEMKPHRNGVERALDTQLSLPDVTPAPNVERRRQVLEQCIQTYRQYRTALNVWLATYPALFDTVHVEPLLNALQELTTLAHDGIRKLPGRGESLRPGNPRVPVVRRLYEVQDVGWVSGIVEHPDSPRQRITITGANGETEVLIIESPGRARLERQAPAPARQNLPDLQAEAQRRLDGLARFIDNIEGHARRNASPQDLEDMMSIKARDLEQRATNLERLNADDPLVATLRDRATELYAKGTALRIAQCFASKTPTEGYLDYLLSHDQVQIVRIDPRRELPRDADNRADFIQEYEVRDVRTVPARSLWFAHFHFGSRNASFEQFTKAHLKLPEQRYKGLKWQAAQVAEGIDAEPIWRGNIGRPLATRHFADL
ncbi:dermonecrotic toxin domain-containing protein [Pseudomonas baltica]|uniref:dermonecrotic toxin domain-containing protein n=1 Tax=Pseudomonas baltica TaxID=2762576 RepID=UPI00289846EC|nr:DUF6543 domain-containing protein [Pseudomonas baltica]